ncbi:response regulator transcription factor [Streptomyces sp. NPDC050548]|uniref:response regulator transcription factor n=1 Tax=Streptomyces sp. NPDC050548 TaxID=3365629 RepID=UPI0037A0743A
MNTPVPGPSSTTSRASSGPMPSVIAYADHLFIGETTVKIHLGRILTKLGLPDRIHAVIFACGSGLARVGDWAATPRKSDYSPTSDGYTE